ncbi:prenyltransferase [Streptomyces sp. GC420]|nr:UbiA family prenyltransferase [Streptomyces sp. GC420]NBM20793.1 prenyltransferase [Streptomyces sp. GC420]
MRAGHGTADGAGERGGDEPRGAARPPVTATTATRARARAWAELLRISAVLTVPGDALAGAAAAGRAPGRRTLLAAGASVCLYEAGMALNDWADRDIDAIERPGRPLPSGRIAPRAALAAAAGLTVAGLALAGRAGRPALAAATALAASVWAYDLHLKNTPAGPAAMATARTLDLLLGAAAESRPPGPGMAAALPSAVLLGAHTLAVTAVSRREAQGGAPGVPLTGLLAALAIGAAVRPHGTGTGTARPPYDRDPPAPARPARHPGRAGYRRRTVPAPGAAAPATAITARAAQALCAAAYVGTVAGPYLHAALNASPPLIQRAVGAGIRAVIPLQAALSARAGAPVTGAALLACAPLARRLARKVSPT